MPFIFMHKPRLRRFLIDFHTQQKRLRPLVPSGQFHVVKHRHMVLVLCPQCAVFLVASDLRQKNINGIANTLHNSVQLNVVVGRVLCVCVEEMEQRANLFTLYGVRSWTSFSVTSLFLPPSLCLSVFILSVEKDEHSKYSGGRLLWCK